MSDRIALVNMRFEGKHGVLANEQVVAQPFEVDAELYLDLRVAGATDDISHTADYRRVFEICRATIEGPSFRLIEALADTIAKQILREFESFGLNEVVIRVRKPAVALPGRLDAASVEIRRSLADLTR